MVVDVFQCKEMETNTFTEKYNLIYVDSLLSF